MAGIDYNSSLEEIIKYIRATHRGVSVTQRVKATKQPRGGYINPRSFDTKILGEGIDILAPKESVYPSLVGTAVDYLTRLMLGTPAEEAFGISLFGASRIHDIDKARNLLDGITGLDSKSIINAVKLSGYDVCTRSSVAEYKPVDEITPDEATISNIKTMVARSLNFFDIYGPKVLDGFTFGDGYTEIVDSGDGDFTTEDTLWDFKVSKNPPTKNHTLQLLMYWRMGLHSGNPEFSNIKYIGIYNPRLNCVYRLSTSNISEDLIEIVEREVIGYNSHISNQQK